MRTSERARWVRAVVTVLLLAASGLAGVVGAQPAQAAGCTLDAGFQTWPVDAQDRPTIVQDGNGTWVPTGETAVATAFLGNYRLTNNGAAIDAWSGRSYTRGSLRLFGAQVWGATQTGLTSGPVSTLSLAGPPWAASLPSGGQVQFGVQGIVPLGSTATRIVIGFALNSTVCTIVRN